MVWSSQGVARIPPWTCVGRYCPIRSVIEGKGGVWGEVKEEEYDEEYDNRGPAYSLTVGPISLNFWRWQRDQYGDWERSSGGVGGNGKDGAVNLDTLLYPHTPTHRDLLTLNAVEMGGAPPLRLHTTLSCTPPLLYLHQLPFRPHCPQ